MLASFLRSAKVVPSLLPKNILSTSIISLIKHDFPMSASKLALAEALLGASLFYFCSNNPR